MSLIKMFLDVQVIDRQRIQLNNLSGVAVAIFNIKSYC
jgi:hypothetical protein